MQPEIVAGDFPTRAELIEKMCRVKTRAHHCAQSFFDGIGLRFKSGQREVRRKRACESRHAARHIQRGGARAGVGIARCHQQHRRDAHGEADARRIQPAHARARGGCGQQHGLTVLMRQRARRECHAQACSNLIAHDQCRQQRLAAGVGVLAHRQHAGQNLYRRLP